MVTLQCPKIRRRACLSWVKSGKAQSEHMLSGLPSIADIDRAERHFRNVTAGDIARAFRIRRSRCAVGLLAGRGPRVPGPRPPPRRRLAAGPRSGPGQPTGARPAAPDGGVVSYLARASEMGTRDGPDRAGGSSGGRRHDRDRTFLLGERLRHYRSACSD
jgi:hypothetical protein